MRIVFFTMSMNRGGAERVISTLCNSIIGRHNKVEILTVLNTPSEYKLNVNIKHSGLITKEEYYKKGKIITLPKVCKLYYKHIKKESPDIVISFLPEPCFIAGIFRKRLNVPLIGSERGNPNIEFSNRTLRAIGNYLYSKADGFVFQTEEARDFFNKKVSNKSLVIGNPITINKSEEIRIEERRKEIVAVGRFTYEKNYQLLIRAWRGVHRRFPEYTLHIYGRYEPECKEVNLIKRLKLEDAIVLEGQVENVAESIKNAYAFVMTSSSEGMPNALMEAMALGLPVVATDCPSGGCRELIQNEYNGLLVDNKNQKAVENAITYLIDNPKTAERLGDKAREIADKYSEEKIVGEWIKCIEQVVI